MNTISLLYVLSGGISALIIYLDLRKRPQSMQIMNSVWMFTGIWAGLLGLLGYYCIGRAPHPEEEHSDDLGEMISKKAKPMVSPMDMPMTNTSEMQDMKKMDMKMDSMKGMNMDMSHMNSMSRDDMSDMHMEKNPLWKSCILSALHCGAGCTLADIIGESLMIILPITLWGYAIFGGWALDYILALAIGILFQYAAIREMQNISPSQAFIKAAKADFLSLTSWQVGMYGWMAIYAFVILPEPKLDHLSFNFWFMMQVAMFCGFLCALPMNLFLIKVGIKKGM